MSSQLFEQVINLTNLERSQANLKPLKFNFYLSKAAQNHSDSMAKDDFFSHTGADGSRFSDRIKDTGYQYKTAGENIAAGQKTAEQVVKAWMNSPGHRANILNPNFTEIGIGYTFLQNDTGSVNYNHYWTQLFATPLSNTNNLNNSTPIENPNTTREKIDNLPIPISNENDDLIGKSQDQIITGDDNNFTPSNNSDKIALEDDNPFKFRQARTTNNRITSSDWQKLYNRFTALGLGNLKEQDNNYESLNFEDVNKYLSEQTLIQENLNSLF